MQFCIESLAEMWNSKVSFCLRVGRFPLSLHLVEVEMFPPRFIPKNNIVSRLDGVLIECSIFKRSFLYHHLTFRESLDFLDLLDL